MQHWEDTRFCVQGIFRRGGRLSCNNPQGPFLEHQLIAHPPVAQPGLLPTTCLVDQAANVREEDLFEVGLAPAPRRMGDGSQNSQLACRLRFDSGNMVPKVKALSNLTPRNPAVLLTSRSSLQSAARETSPAHPPCPSGMELPRSWTC